MMRRSGVSAQFQSGLRLQAQRCSAPSHALSAPPPWDIRDELGPNDCVTMLSRPLERPIVLRAPQASRSKPCGLWYSVGPAWLDWIREEMPGWERERHYRITLDRSRLLVLRTVEEAEAFTREYSADSDMDIAWHRVAAKWGGIEIAPYHRRLSTRGICWYNCWDVASGAVWDDSVILTTELIPRHDADEASEEEEASEAEAEAPSTTPIDGQPR